MKQFVIGAWFFVLGFIVCFLILKEDKHENYENYVVIPLDNYENGRQVFHVKHRDSVYKFVYPEEFANRLIKGQWEYDEDLQLVDREFCKHNTPNSIMILPSDTINGKPTYSVIFEDEKGLDNMTGEDIGIGLSKNIWNYKN